MSARILDGKAIAGDLLESLAARVSTLRDQNIVPHLVFVLIGEEPEAEMYAGRLERLAERSQMRVTRHRLPEDVSPEALGAEIGALNGDEAVDGILVQMPLPSHLSLLDLSPSIDPYKDVDGITVHNAGCLYLGLPGQRPSTAAAILHIIERTGISPRGMHAVVVGRSSIVGHPVAELLLHHHATVTMTHSRTRDLAAMTKQADILVVAAGRAGLVTGAMVKPGVVILDAGINPTPAGLVGDVDFDSCLEVAAAITPVPGGVGPVTNAVLLRHLVESAERRLE